MRPKRLNRKADSLEFAHVVAGLVLLAIILFAIATIIGKFGRQVITYLGNEVKKGLLSIVVDSGSALTKASEPNFRRLNEELASLLESHKRIDHVVVPYA